MCASPALCTLHRRAAPIALGAWGQGGAPCFSMRLSTVKRADAAARMKNVVGHPVPEFCSAAQRREARCEKYRPGRGGRAGRGGAGRECGIERGIIPEPLRGGRPRGQPLACGRLYVDRIEAVAASGPLTPPPGVLREGRQRPSRENGRGRGKRPGPRGEAPHRTVGGGWSCTNIYSGSGGKQ